MIVPSAPAPRRPVRAYGTPETLADTAVNGAGLGAALIGLVALIYVAVTQGNALTVTSFTIYGGALVLSFAASLLYNAIRPWKTVPALRLLDHAAIYALIAGTYTPFMLVGVGGWEGWTLGLTVWGLALVGIALKALRPGRFERVAIALYLALGWIGIVALEPLLDRLPLGALVLLGAGGVLYSLGVPFHVWSRLPFHNVIWHAFVLVAAICHLLAILLFVRPAAL